MEMDRTLMVKQFMGRVQLRYGLANVYVSGQPGYYVFRPLTPDNQSEGGLEFAYKATDMKPRRQWHWVV